VCGRSKHPSALRCIVSRHLGKAHASALPGHFSENLPVHASLARVQQLDVREELPEEKRQSGSEELVIIDDQYAHFIVSHDRIQSERPLHSGRCYICSNHPLCSNRFHLTGSILKASTATPRSTPSPLPLNAIDVVPLVSTWAVPLFPTPAEAPACA
jgi:hypothetical protein